MKKDKKKLEHMKSICKQQDLFPKIIKATEGKKLHNKFIAKHHSFNSIHDALSLGEIGCAYSHINVYKEILKNKLAFSLILEDDVNFSGNIKELLSEATINEDKWDIIHFGHHSMSSRKKETQGSYWNRVKIKKNYRLLLPCELAAGTYGYLITYNGAKKLLAQLNCLEQPIDHYTGSSMYCNCLILSPPAILINDFYSNNYNDMQERAKANYSSTEKSYIIKKIKILALTLGIYKILDSIALKILLTLKSITPKKKYK
ncbi:MAG: glycosyltransferase family 25 protein [Methylococcaceae bacterium]|nr:glycosyltransferase family 25 protein [Methylococcaceae bacterium]